MILSKTIQTKHVEGIGPVMFRRNRRTRYIRIRVDQKDGIILTIPESIPEQQALRYLYEKRNWIERSVLKQQKISTLNTVFTEVSEFKTRKHILCLAKHTKSTIRSVVSGDKIIVWYPDHAQVEDLRIQKVIRRAVEEAWRIEAKKDLPERVSKFAKQFDFQYRNLTVKNAKTRWGSCSHTNNINLNLQLMRLPDRLIDYVILHELTHTLHKNHQKAFWHALEKFYPGAKNADKELNNYHLKYW
jgi:predicted metal-dependent hydrolase